MLDSNSWESNPFDFWSILVTSDELWKWHTRFSVQMRTWLSGYLCRDRDIVIEFSPRTPRRPSRVTSEWTDWRSDVIGLARWRHRQLWPWRKDQTRWLQGIRIKFSPKWWLEKWESVLKCSQSSYLFRLKIEQHPTADCILLNLFMTHNFHSSAK